MKTGIYEIKNTVNGKWYRGQVKASYGFNGRFRRHKQKLIDGKHKNKHLQSSWNKYGEDAFKFSILSRCAPEFCDELEEYWIGEDYNNPAVSYNKMAGGGAGGSPSDEAKQKMSAAKKGKNHHYYGKNLSEQHKARISEAQKGAKNYRYAPFTVTWEDGRVDRWETIGEAASHYNANGNTIWNYLNGKSEPGRYSRTRFFKNTIFKYEGE